MTPEAAKLHRLVLEGAENLLADDIARDDRSGANLQPRGLRHRVPAEPFRNADFHRASVEVVARSFGINGWAQRHLYVMPAGGSNPIAIPAKPLIRAVVWETSDCQRERGEGKGEAHNHKASPEAL